MGVLPRAAIRVHTTSSVRRRAVTATKVIPSTITAAVVVLGNVATTAVTVRFVLQTRADATTPRPRVTTSLARELGALRWEREPVDGVCIVEGSPDIRHTAVQGWTRSVSDCFFPLHVIRGRCPCLHHTRSSQCLSTLLLGEVGGV